MRPSRARTHLTMVLALALSGLALTSCSEPPTQQAASAESVERSSKKPEGYFPPAAEAALAATQREVSEPEPSDPIEKSLWALRKEYAPHMSSIMPVTRGQLEAGERRDFQVVFEGERCAKILAVSDKSLYDLDLMLYGPSGAAVQQDPSGDRTPSIGVAHPFCPQVAGTYRLRVRAHRGEGNFAFRAYQTAK